MKKMEKEEKEKDLENQFKMKELESKIKVIKIILVNIKRN